MPACQYRSWSANDFSKSRPDTQQSKEMDEKLKKMMADRNALDAKISNIEKTNSSKRANPSEKNVPFREG